MVDCNLPTFFLGSDHVRIEDVLAMAQGGTRVAITPDPDHRRFIEQSHQMLMQRLETGDAIYGVATGFGESCTTEVNRELAEQMALNLVRFHGCGVGKRLDEIQSASVVAVRATSLAKGYSAVRLELLERLCDLLNHRILPCIPSEGSVGASGDLTPLSYVAATLIGEREVICDRKVIPAAEALAAAGLEPLTLAPKESLAIMNGTAVMTGLACLAFERAARLSRFASALTAMASDTMRGNQAHFDDRIFALKPHAGQRASARWVREDIEYQAGREPVPNRIQDRYSVRCAPHVIGVLLDALPFIRTTLETEINGVSDNPLIDAEQGDILHGGNFYGGHVCMAMDMMKAAVANIADLLDRQFALLCDTTTNQGLPPNLVFRTSKDRVSHHGFKAMQITASALTAEALKLTTPASIFSRSTECHNQDKVSMGTIASRDCLRVLELTETVAVIHLLALCQAVDIRQGGGCHARSLAMRDAVRQLVPTNDADRRQDQDIYDILELYLSDRLPVGDMDFDTEQSPRAVTDPQ